MYTHTEEHDRGDFAQCSQCPRIEDVLILWENNSLCQNCYNEQQGREYDEREDR